MRVLNNEGINIYEIHQAYIALMAMMSKSESNLPPTNFEHLRFYDTNISMVGLTPRSSTDVNGVS